MIYIAKEKDIGENCGSCRFYNRETMRCIADGRIDTDIIKDENMTMYRPYECPFRYYDAQVNQIIKRFQDMTEEETKGWFEGADFTARRYVELEEERSRFVESLNRRKNGDSDVAD